MMSRGERIGWKYTIAAHAALIRELAIATDIAVIEVTEPMIEAGLNQLFTRRTRHADTVADIYRAMEAARVRRS